MTGKLYGVGVGPGDPELLTLKALRIIKESEVIAIPVSDLSYSEAMVENPTFTPTIAYEDTCISYNIARQTYDAISNKRLIYLPMPMTKDKEFLKQCHDIGTNLITTLLQENKMIAFLTLGDPTVYSTYLYIHKRVDALGFDTEIISGIPSFCAVAAKLNMGLVENSDQLHVIPASYQIDDSLTLPGTKVLMKPGRAIPKIKEALKDHEEQISMVENCGMENERVYTNLEDIKDKSSYYSLIIIK